MSLVVPFEDLFADETKLLAKHESWERVELGEVCEVLNGFAFKSALFNKRDGIPVVRIRDLMRGRTETFYKGDYPNEYLVENGDLLVGMDGNFGCYEWSGGEALLNQRVCKLSPRENSLDRKFLLFGINGYLKAIQEATSSVTVGHLSSRDIQRIPFPFPSLNEQRRIVAKLEELLRRVDSARARFATIPSIVKRFRQSVLAAACSGQLTTDWRAKTHPLNDGSNGHRLPENWSEQLFSHFIADSFYGPRFSKESYVARGVPTIRTTDMGFDGSIALNDSPCLKLSNTELEKYGLQHGDLLVTRTGATIGKCAVYDKGLGAAIPSAYLIRFRLKLNLMEPKFALRFLMSPAGQNLLVGGSTAVAQPNVNATTISQFILAVPPLAEQQEIVRRVEALFKTADALEARYRTAKVHVDKLTQSILAKAFRGELVPQDPTDEPASVLLERIRASRNGPATRPAKRKESRKGM